MNTYPEMKAHALVSAACSVRARAAIQGRVSITLVVIFTALLVYFIFVSSDLGARTRLIAPICFSLVESKHYMQVT